jgi:septal ring factor EnvC (AmiA/AmiB activator)|tara:strand:- start:104 stop:328 length:225 start_codon:yes stop_codon:yes gene_type:complete
MALEIEAIQKRKVALEGDVEKVRDTISQLDTKRQELVNNLNALSGAIQQCDQFIVELEEEENPKEEEPKTKKEK